MSDLKIIKNVFTTPMGLRRTYGIIIDGVPYGEIEYVEEVE
jgi:hypothetical protein